MKGKIVIIVPVYNEAANLHLFHRELSSAVSEIESHRFEYLFVNDGSLDLSLTALQQLRQQDSCVGYLSLSRNFGKEIAMVAGLDHLPPDTEAVIFMDADLQHPPCLIKDMVRFWEEGFDDVYALRENRNQESFLKRRLTGFFYKAINMASEVEIVPNAGDFRLLSRKAFESIQKLRESQRFTKGMYSWIGFRKKALSFRVPPRVQGDSKWGRFKLIRLAIDGITSFTTAPLRFATFFGFLCSLLSFAWLLKVFIKTLLYGDPVGGYPSLMIVVLFIGGVQLICIGIIGEYIGKVFNESKRRPLYFVDQVETND